MADKGSILKLDSQSGAPISQKSQLFGEYQIGIVAQSPFKEIVVAASAQSGTLKALDANSLEVVYEASCHDDLITGVTFSPQGFFVVCSLDGTCSIHDVVNKCVLAKFDVQEKLHAIELHPDGLILAVGLANGKIRVYDIRDLTL